MKLIKAAVTTAVAGLVLGLAQAPASAVNIGSEGCTPGYWKNHTSNWEEYKPTRLVGTVFTAAPAPYAGMTMQQALSLRGGSGTAGSTEILLRAATAAVLNAAHEGVGYPYRRFNTPFRIVEQVNAALAGSRQQMLTLAATLDAANNLGCPLS